MSFSTNRVMAGTLGLGETMLFEPAGLAANSFALGRKWLENFVPLTRIEWQKAVGLGQILRDSITFCHECFSRTNTLEPQNLTPSGEPAFYNLGPRFHSPPHFNSHL
jgi:hypothetical protein